MPSLCSVLPLLFLLSLSFSSAFEEVPEESLTCSDVERHFVTEGCCEVDDDAPIDDATVFRLPADDPPLDESWEDDVLTDMIVTSYGINLGRAPTQVEYAHERSALADNRLSGNDLDYFLAHDGEYDALRGFVHQHDDLTSHYVLCIGCSSGLGLWTAMQLAQMGAHVYACARTQAVWDANMQRALEAPETHVPTSLNPQWQTPEVLNRMHFRVADVRDASSIAAFVEWALEQGNGQGRTLHGAIVAWPSHPVVVASGEFYDEPSWQADLAATGPEAGGRFAPLTFSTANEDKFNSPWNSQGIGTIKAIQKLIPVLLQQQGAALVVTCAAEDWLTGADLGDATSTGGKFGYGSGVHSTAGRLTLMHTVQEAASSGVSTRVVAVGPLNTERSAIALLTKPYAPLFASVMERLARTYWSYGVDPATLDFRMSDWGALLTVKEGWTGMGGKPLGSFDLLPGLPECDYPSAAAWACARVVQDALTRFPAAFLDESNTSIPFLCNISNYEPETYTWVGFEARLQEVLAQGPDCQIGAGGSVIPLPFTTFQHLLHIMRQFARDGDHFIYGPSSNPSGSPTAYHVAAAAKGVVEALLNPEMENTYLTHNTLRRGSELGVTLAGHLHDQKAVAWNFERYVGAALVRFTGRPVDSGTLGRPAWRVRMF